MKFKILGNYKGSSENEVIDEGFHTKREVQEALREYTTAFGLEWGPLWITDEEENIIE